ncbi:MAG TPA: uroporphyrinogen decarboxylase family protein [Bacteroidales bacterium]
MTTKQWEALVSASNGQKQSTLPIGFIIDCPWLPNWYGINIIDYFTNDQIWLDANFKAIETFPEVIFLPGFWSEYGMCTEPSAFGAKCIFHKNEFPFAEKIIHAFEDIDSVTEPNPESDGLLPFMLNRLRHAQPLIEKKGHAIKFSVSRGPLNIATFLMGVTEFLTLMMMDPERAHKLLRIITNFLHRWHELQRKTFPSIEGILMLDDIVGFIGEAEFKEFAYPYFKELYDNNMKVKFFHNDAECEASVAYYPELGINLYNPGIYTHINKLFDLTGHKLTILGNIPPRDVLASGTAGDVEDAVKKLLSEVNDRSRLLLSCAGGMPPQVSTNNLTAFINAAK